MKKKWTYILAIILIAIAIFITIVQANNRQKQNYENNNFKIVTSFYPIYTIAENLVEGAQNVELVNMTELNVGCLHDYTLSTTDMKKIESADVFIKNGLGLESFMDKIITTYPNLKIIDSSENLAYRIQEGKDTNPHIWTNINNYISQVEVVYEKLCEYNPENKEIYTTNYENYMENLNELKSKYDNELKDLKGKKAICLNESFIYLSKGLNMDVTTVKTDHEESTLSAETLKNLIDEMKSEKIEIILVDENDNLNNAETLAAETGAKIYKLNSCMTGENNKNSYINNMEKNLEILKQM